MTIWKKISSTSGKGAYEGKARGDNMEKKISSTSLKINLVLNTFLQILSTIAPLLTAPYISRVLGPENIGIFSYTLSINSYFVLIAGLGTASYGIIEIAKVRDSTSNRSRVFWGIELISIITSSLSLAIWLFMIMFYRKYSIIFAIQSLYILATVFDISWFYLGIEKLKHTVVINSFFKILGVILIFIFVKSKSDLLIYIFILSFSSLLGNFSMWLFLQKYITLAKVSIREMKNHFKGTFIYFVPTIAATIYSVVDKTLIGIITKDAIENGCYEQAGKIIGLVRSVAYTSINTLFSSRMAYLFTQNKQGEIKFRLKMSLDLVLILSYGACFGIIAIAQDFVPIFFGAGYSRVVGFLALMAPLLPIMGISSSVGYLYYNPSGNRKKSATILVIGTLINCLLNVVLITLYAGYGAIVASLIAEILITVLYIIYSNGYVTFNMIFKLSLKKIISGLCMVTIIQILSRVMECSIMSLLLQISCGAVIYCIVLILLRDEFIFNMTLKGISLIKRRLYKNG